MVIPIEQIIQDLDELKQQLCAILQSKQPPIEIINREELCKRLGITGPTVIRWEKKGKIPSIRIGNSIRYNWPSVIQTLEKN